MLTNNSVNNNRAFWIHLHQLVSIFPNLCTAVRGNTCDEYYVNIMNKLNLSCLEAVLVVLTVVWRCLVKAKGRKNAEKCNQHSNSLEGVSSWEDSNDLEKYIDMWREWAWRSTTGNVSHENTRRPNRVSAWPVTGH